MEAEAAVDAEHDPGAYADAAQAAQDDGLDGPALGDLGNEDAHEGGVVKGQGEEEDGVGLRETAVADGVGEEAHVDVGREHLAAAVGEVLQDEPGGAKDEDEGHEADGQIHRQITQPLHALFHAHKRSQGKHRAHDEQNDEVHGKAGVHTEDLGDGRRDDRHTHAHGHNAHAADDAQDGQGVDDLTQGLLILVVPHHLAADGADPQVRDFFHIEAVGHAHAQQDEHDLHGKAPVEKRIGQGIFCGLAGVRLQAEGRLGQVEGPLHEGVVDGRSRQGCAHHHGDVAEQGVFRFAVAQLDLAVLAKGQIQADEQADEDEPEDGNAEDRRGVIEDHVDRIDRCVRLHDHQGYEGHDEGHAGDGDRFIDH